MANQAPKKQTKQPDQKPKRSKWSWVYYVVMISLLILMFYPSNKGGDKDLSYTEFTAYIENSISNK